MHTSPAAGLTGVVSILGDEALRRGTGAIEIDGQEAIYVVFGHPLHAVCAGTSGVAAIDALARLLLEQPGLEARWIAGRTAANLHSLAPSDLVLDRLRGYAQAAIPAVDHDESAGSPVGDLHLRRLAAVDAAGASEWDALVDELCATFEGRLHRHAQPLTDSLRGAPRNAEGLLVALRSARSRTIRAVSSTDVASLLADAEERVSQTLK
ncbi:MAG: hypothetical protein ABR573_07160 [Candidatus Dormibacteria bacterium]